MTPPRQNTRNWGPNGRDRPHHGVETWHLAKNLVAEAYRVTAEFPKHEKFELTSQIRRAAVSIPSNIAEGKGRKTDRQYLRFLYMARSSLEEFDTQLEIADDLGYLDNIDVRPAFDIFDNLSRALQGLIDSVEADVSTK